MISGTRDHGDQGHSHDDEADNVNPDGQIAYPSKALETPNQAENHTNGHDNDHACNEADAIA